MRTLRSILLSTDFRDSSERAAQTTIRLAKTFGSRVTVLHVREPFVTWPVSPLENQDQLTEQLNNSGIELTEFRMHAGSPADVVLQQTRDVDPDLLVIGGGEKVRDGHLSLGPIAEAILERASPPVLLLNPVGPALEFKTILCPVDISAVSRRALEDAIHLARAFGSKLVVLTVIPDGAILSTMANAGLLEEARIERELSWVREFEEFLSKISFDGVTWQREVRPGSAAEQIVIAAREYGADLLVMGSTGRTGLARVLLGSVARRVLKQLPCSLLLTKDQAAFEEQILDQLETIDRLAQEGKSHLEKEEYTLAAGRFRQVLIMDPYHTPALEGLIKASEQLGQPEAAQPYRDRVERLRKRK